MVATQSLQMDKPTIVKKLSVRENLLETGIPYKQMLDKRRAERSDKYRYRATLFLLSVIVVVLFAAIFVIQDLGHGVRNLNKAWENAVREEYKIICSMSLPVDHYTIEFDGRMPWKLEYCPYVEAGNETLLDTSVYEDSKPVQVNFPIYFNVTQSGIYMIQLSVRLLAGSFETNSNNYEIDLLKPMYNGEPRIELGAFTFNIDREHSEQVIVKLKRGDLFYLHLVQAMVIVREPKLEILKLYNLSDY